MFAVTLAGGKCLAVSDVCKVPAPSGAVPTIFPNSGEPPMGSEPAAKVLVSGMPALTKASSIPLSSGDELGTVGGVVSNKVGAQVEFIDGSLKVKFEGNPAVRLSTMTKHNAGNTVGLVVAPSQNKVLILS